MIVATMTVTLHAPWVHSLKEKRRELKSIMIRLSNKFNISVTEAASQDIHQTIVIGVAAIATSSAQADSILDHVLNFIESRTEAEVTAIQRDHR